MPWASCGVHPLRSGIRRLSLRDVGHLVDPAAVGEHAVGVHVVRLPERARVGRDREAADVDLVADHPRRERHHREHRHGDRRHPAAAAPQQEHGEHERQQRSAGRSRGSRRPTRAPSSDGRPERAALGREQRQPEHRRAEQLVEDLAVPVQVVPDEVGLKRRDAPPRSGRSRADRNRRPISKTTSDVADRDHELRGPDRPPVEARRSRRSGSGTSRRAAACRPRDGPGRSRTSRGGGTSSASYSRLLEVRRGCAARSCSSTTSRGSAHDGITMVYARRRVTRRARLQSPRSSARPRVGACPHRGTRSRSCPAPKATRSCRATSSDRSTTRSGSATCALLDRTARRLPDRVAHAAAGRGRGRRARSSSGPARRPHAARSATTSTGRRRRTPGRPGPTRPAPFAREGAWLRRAGPRAALLLRRRLVHRRRGDGGRGRPRLRRLHRDRLASARTSPEGSPRASLDQPARVVLDDGRRVLELPDHALARRCRQGAAPCRSRPSSTCTSTTTSSSTPRRRAALTATLVLLARRRRPVGLDAAHRRARGARGTTYAQADRRRRARRARRLRLGLGVDARHPDQGRHEPVPGHASSTTARRSSPRSKDARLRYQLAVDRRAVHTLTNVTSSKGDVYQVATDEPGRTATVTVAPTPTGARIELALHPATDIQQVLRRLRHGARRALPRRRRARRGRRPARADPLRRGRLPAAATRRSRTSRAPPAGACRIASQIPSALAFPGSTGG